MRKVRALVPLAVTLVGLVGIGGLWVGRILALSSTVGGALALAALFAYGGWLAWESRVSVSELDRLGPDEDRGTMELAAAAKVSLLVASLLPATAPALSTALPGLALIAGGALFRASAIRALGPSYGHRIRVPELPLVTTGPYAIVRHPAYLGTLAAHAGLALVFANPYSFAALFGLWVPAVIVRTVLEDRVLFRLPAYRAYAAEVPSTLLPSPRHAMKHLQARLPVLLSIGSVAAIVALVLTRLGDWSPATRAASLTLVGAYLVWLGVESRVAVKEIGKGTTSLDRGTLELYAFGRFVTMLLAVGLGRPEGARCAIGAAIFVAALVLRLAAIRELGSFYSHRVRLNGDHAIVDTGPYRVVRHPAYTGMLLAHAGVVLFFFHPAAVGALLGVLLPAVVLRIRVEERALMTIDGYRAYSEGRPRLVPRVW
jgi:protein-S-isoprenylcysteine O-methyltransferase Ste14